MANTNSPIALLDDLRFQRDVGAQDSHQPACMATLNDIINWEACKIKGQYTLVIERTDGTLIIIPPILVS